MPRLLFLLIFLIAGPVVSQEKSFTLKTPDALIESGFIKHLLPRFSLKTGIRITPITEDGDAAFGATGVPVFQGEGTIWHFSKEDGPYTDAFLMWLLSDVGKRTIEAFKIDDVALFSADVMVEEVVEEASLSGDMVLGESASLSKCGRCHVVNESNKMNAIGSTPSFALMRSFPDWQERFETFFILKPHPAFTQVEDVTEPFPDNLPSPIAPIEVTLEEIEAITAYVGSIVPADLGAPIQSQ